MEYFLLEQLSLCLAALSHRTTSCSVELTNDPVHYSGNFWSATCDIPQKLCRIKKSSNYIAVELWIGKGKYVRRAKYDGLNNFLVDFYRHLVPPKNYSLSNTSMEMLERHIAASIIYKNFKNKIFNNVL